MLGEIVPTVRFVNDKQNKTKLKMPCLIKVQVDHVLVDLDSFDAVLFVLLQLQKNK